MSTSILLWIIFIKNKLLAASCTANTLHPELCKILLAYRRSIHPTTGRSRAMAMFGRQINSRLDLLLPQNSNTSYTTTTKTFFVGEKVAVRDYLPKQKWRFGVIDDQLGELHYNVKLDDGRIWKRHVDQMRKVGEMIGAPSVKEQESVAENSTNARSCPLVDINHPQQNSNTPPVRRYSIVITTSTPDVTEVEPTIPTVIEEAEECNPATSNSQDLVGESNVRRSNRIRKKPLKLLD